MNRPNPLTIYPDIDLKLGIKSSFPNIRSALAMIIFLWVVSDSPGELEYSVQDKDQIILTNDLSEKIISMIDTFEIISNIHKKYAYKPRHDNKSIFLLYYIFL